MTIAPPKPATLAKYGLTEEEWREILKRQGGVCAVCKLAPKTGRYNVDHEHVKGWSKMPAEKRKVFVRGVVCWWCNKQYMSRAITIEKARNVVKYLEDYAARWVNDWIPR